MALSVKGERHAIGSVGAVIPRMPRRPFPLSTSTLMRRPLWSAEDEIGVVLLREAHHVPL